MPGMGKGLWFSFDSLVRIPTSNFEYKTIE